MINQTIVSLGGAYVESVSNPPDANLQTSHSVGGGVSNERKSNEGNTTTTRGQRSLLLLSQLGCWNNTMRYELYSANGLIRRNGWFKNTINLASGGKDRFHEHSLGIRQSNILQYFQGLRLSANCVRLNSESGVVV